MNRTLETMVPRIVIICMVFVFGLSCQHINGLTIRRAPCPCSNPALCEPIKTIAKKEVAVFSTNGPTWKDYFWDNITTVLVLRGFDPQIMCHAHSKGVRVVVWGDAFDTSILFNKSARNAWVERTVQEAAGNFTDGYNIDFESTLNQSQAHLLVDMVRQIKDAFKQALPYSIVSFDTPYAPGCTWGRCYDYPSLAGILDYLMIMAYDMVNRDGRANANEPYNETVKGVNEFLKAGIPSSKLVLIVPWYGYDFPCSMVTPSDACLYNISASTPQRGYGNIMDLLAENSTTGRQWSEAYMSPYFNYKNSDTGQTHQVWYDDPISLDLRFKMAKEKDLYGVSVFHADCLDYSNKQRAVNQTNLMWDALIGEF